MEKKLTVDANVALKWFIQEDYSEKALQLLQAFRDGTADLNAPPIIHYETGNALWILSSKLKQVDQEYTKQAYRHLLALPLRTTHLDSDDLQEALNTSYVLNLTYYDALYIVTAKKTRSTLVSADQELVRKAKQVIGATHIADMKI